MNVKMNYMKKYKTKKKTDFIYNFIEKIKL